MVFMLETQWNVSCALAQAIDKAEQAILDMLDLTYLNNSKIQQDHTIFGGTQNDRYGKQYARCLKE